ncbi:MAG: glycosyltransferase family 2 protein [Desulfomonilaceae bacterium]
MLVKSPEYVDLEIDGRNYSIELFQQTALPVGSPRLIVVSHLANEVGKGLLKTCLDGIQHFTPESHEVWVVDNNSPRENLDWLLERNGVNIALNRVEPLPPEAHSGLADHEIVEDQKNWGSYANAIGLEIGIRLIDPLSTLVMFMHMDTFPCFPGWLSFLRSKIVNNVRAAGVRLDRTRTPEGVLHVLGYMVDFQLYKRLGLNVFPDLPQRDVGDNVTLRLREEGYEIFACNNTLWSPELDERIPAGAPLKRVRVDRAFDDDWNIIFLHLGRGVRKSIGEHKTGTGFETWSDLIYNSLIKDVTDCSSVDRSRLD